MYARHLSDIYQYKKLKINIKSFDIKFINLNYNQKSDL